MKNILLRAIKRYWLSEIFGIIGVYAGFFLTEKFSHITWIDAYGAAFGENVGFYGAILFQRLRSKEKLWHILAEFGPAEFLDSLILRPATLFAGVKIFGPIFGLFVGKIAGDIVFYIPVILTHEFMKKYFKK